MADPRVIYDSLIRQGPDGFYPENEPVGVEDYQATMARISAQLALITDGIRAPKRRLPVDVLAQANTDGSGNVTFPIYQVGAGFDLYVISYTVEAESFTPAAPYTNAAFWLGLFVSPNQKAVSQGGMIDFIPTTAGSQGMPAVTQPSGGASWIIRSGNFLVADCHGGPASKRLTVHLDGYLEAQS